MSYPLRYVRPHPGRKPPFWRPLARWRWSTAILERDRAKAFNFAHNYGARVTKITTHKPTTRE